MTGTAWRVSAPISNLEGDKIHEIRQEKPPHCGDRDSNFPCRRSDLAVQPYQEPPPGHQGGGAERFGAGSRAGERHPAKYRLRLGQCVHPERRHRHRPEVRQRGERLHRLWRCGGLSGARFGHRRRTGAGDGKHPAVQCCQSEPARPDRRQHRHHAAQQRHGSGKRGACGVRRRRTGGHLRRPAGRCGAGRRRKQRPQLAGRCLPGHL